MGGGGGGGVQNVMVLIFMSSKLSLGGGGGPPPIKFRNMKCSRSDSRNIPGLLTVSSFPHIIFPIYLRYFLKEKTLLIFHKESTFVLFFHNYLN